ncbi:MAG: response regulator transcription factor [Chloroflexota bacterium]
MNQVSRPYSLSPREREVLALIGAGKANKEIAIETGMTYNTVKIHVRSVLQKMGVHSRTLAAIKYLQEDKG